MDIRIFIWGAVIMAGLALFYFYARAGRFFRCAFLGCISGFCALGALWIAGHFFEISLAITPLTLAISAVFGAPGVIGMLILPVL